MGYPSKSSWGWSGDGLGLVLAVGLVVGVGLGWGLVVVVVEVMAGVDFGPLGSMELGGLVVWNPMASEMACVIDLRRKVLLVVLAASSFLDLVVAATTPPSPAAPAPVPSTTTSPPIDLRLNPLATVEPSSRAIEFRRWLPPPASAIIIFSIFSRFSSIWANVFNFS